VSVIFCAQQNKTVGVEEPVKERPNAYYLFKLITWRFQVMELPEGLLEGYLYLIKNGVATLTS
jgi:hypothetical protein